MNQITNQRKKSFVSKADWFSFQYPNDWQTEEDDYVAVYNPAEGLGALHISAYQAPSEVDPKAELIEQLSDESPAQAHEQVRTFRSVAIEWQPLTRSRADHVKRFGSLLTVHIWLSRLI